jgi:hypothetical protein
LRYFKDKVVFNGHELEIFLIGGIVTQQSILIFQEWPAIISLCMPRQLVPKDCSLADSILFQTQEIVFLNVLFEPYYVSNPGSNKKNGFKYT